MKKLVLVALILVIAVGLVLAGCGKEAPAKPATTTSPTPSPTPATPVVTPKTGGELKVISGAAVNQMGGPAEVPIAGIFWRTQLTACFERLFYQELGTDKLLPGLAKSWDIAPDGKSMTLYLRDDVKFHDGTQFNAAAVKYNLEAQIATPVGKTNLRTVTSVDVINDYTVKLNFSEFSAVVVIYNLAAQEGIMASPTALQQKATAETLATGLHTVGAGAFKFGSWTQGLTTKMVKWDGYYRKGLPYLDAIQYTAIADPVTRTMAFRSGQGNWLNNISITDAAGLEKEGYLISVNKFYYMNSYFPDGANADSPWSNVKVRQAFEYAIDREAIAKVSGQYSGKYGTGGAKSVYQLAVPEDSFYNKDLAPRLYNVDKAKQLLTEAGFPNGFTTSIYVQSGMPLDVPQLMQGYLAAVNIKAEIVPYEQAKLFSLRNDGWRNGLMPGMGGPMGRLNQWENNFRAYPPNTNFRSMYRPPGLNDMISACVSKVDYNERSKLQKDLIKLFYDNAMGFPISVSYELQAYDKSVKYMPEHYVQPSADSYFAENWVDFAKIWIDK